MKKNIFMRILAIALIAMSVMAVATSALASYDISATVETSKNGNGGKLNKRNAPNGSLVTRIPNLSTIYVESLSGTWLHAKYGNYTG